LRQALVTSSAGTAGKTLDALLHSARQVAADSARSPAQRVEAIRTLPLGQFGDIRELLSWLIENHQPPEVQLAALTALGRFTDTGIPGLILKAWPQFSPSIRAEATEILFARSEWLGLLLEEIATGRWSSSEIDPARVKLLLAHPRREIRQRAEQLFSEMKLGRRQDVVAAYQAALERKGNPERGKQAFARVCAPCHKLEGIGHEIGPNLATVQNRGPDAMILNVLDPNREVNPQYVNYVVQTKDGRTLTGMISAENATSLTLTRAENSSDTILRMDIEEMRGTGMSMMPEGLERELDIPAMADLLAYLMSLR
jgi:putative heme-binding domain-containing protein